MATQIFLIRHAPTEANLVGSMVKNYDSTSIIPLTEDVKNEWYSRIASHMPYQDVKYLASPALRCRQTADALFPGESVDVCDYLAEFDCSGLGDNKFWELSKDEFEKLVPLTSDEMGSRANEFINHCIDVSQQAVVAVSHGMFIRYMIHFMTGNRDISAYEVINSVGIQFANLDMVNIDMDTHTVNIFPFKKPINHKD